MFKKNWPVIIIIILVIIYFLPVIFLNKLPYSSDLGGSDLLDFNYAQRYYYSQLIKVGELPFWSDEIASGFPLLSEGQLGGLYPLNLLLYYFFDFIWAFKISLVLHVFLASFFTYILARLLSLDKRSALISGLVFGLSGFFMAHLKHVNMVNSASWLPLLMYFIEKFCQKKSFRYVIYAGLVFGLQLLAGHVQIALFSCIIVGGYHILREIFANNRTEFFLKVVMRVIFFWLIIFFVGITVAAPQLFLTIELIGHSNRMESFNYETATAYPWHPRNLLTFIFPFIHGNPAHNTYLYNFEDISQRFGLWWENIAYIGLVPLFFVFLALLYFKKNNNIKIFSILIFVFFIFILGRYSFFYKTLWFFLSHVIEYIRVVRVPNRFLIGVELSLALLAGYGWFYFSNKIKNLKFQGKIYFFLLLIIFIDLSYFFYSYHAFWPEKKMEQNPKMVDYLQQDQELFRIYPLGVTIAFNTALNQAQGWLSNNTEAIFSQREIIPANQNLLYDLDQPFNKIGLNLSRSSRLQDFLEGIVYSNNDSLNQFPQSHHLKLNDSFIKVISLLNIKYLTSYFELENNHLTLVKKVDLDTNFLPARIYLNNNYLPRVWFVTNSLVLKQEDEILQTLAKDTFNPEETVILEHGLPVAVANRQNSRVEIIEWHNRELIFKASLNQAGFIVISNSYYPGWQALVNDQPHEIVRANFVFQALSLPAGEYLIKLNYRPKFFYYGLYFIVIVLTIITCYFIILFFGKCFFSKDSKK